MKKQFFVDGTIKEGKFKANNEEQFKFAFGNFKEGDKVTVSVQTLLRKRTEPQNDWYWAVIVPAFVGIFQECGYRISEPQDAHELLQLEFLGKEIVNEKTGEIKKGVRSTSSLSTIEFVDYAEKCIQFAAEFFDIQIPYPNEKIK